MIGWSDMVGCDLLRGLQRGAAHVPDAERWWGASRAASTGPAHVAEGAGSGESEVLGLQHGAIKYWSQGYLKPSDMRGSWGPRDSCCGSGVGASTVMRGGVGGETTS